jgi:MFS family permease
LEEVTKEGKRNYYILVAAMASMQITVSTIYMVLPVFFSQYGMSKTDNGTLIAIGTFAGIISSLFAGKFSDTIGRKPILLVGVSVYALVFILFAFMGKNFQTFFALRFLEGLAYYMVPVATTTMAADIFPKKDRGKAMGLQSMANGVGQLIGPLLAGVFIDASDFLTYFLFCGGFVMVAAAIIFIFVKETLPSDVKAHHLEQNAKSKGQGFSFSRIVGGIKGLGAGILVFFLATTIYRTGYTMVNPLFSIYLTEELHMSMTTTSYFFVIRAVINIVFAPMAGFLADRWGRKPTFILGMTILGGTMVAYSQATTLELVLVIRSLESLSTAILTPTTRTMVADMLTPKNRGFGTGLYSALNDESSTFGAIAGGYIADLYDFKTIFLIGAGTAAACMGIVFFAVKEPSKDDKGGGKVEMPIH